MSLPRLTLPAVIAGVGKRQTEHQLERPACHGMNTASQGSNLNCAYDAPPRHTVTMVTACTD